MKTFVSSSGSVLVAVTTLVVAAVDITVADVVVIVETADDDVVTDEVVAVVAEGDAVVTTEAETTDKNKLTTKPMIILV